MSKKNKDIEHLIGQLFLGALLASRGSGLAPKKPRRVVDISLTAITLDSGHVEWFASRFYENGQRGMCPVSNPTDGLIVLQQLWGDPNVVMPPCDEMHWQMYTDFVMLGLLDFAVEADAKHQAKQAAPRQPESAWPFPPIL